MNSRALITAATGIQQAGTDLPTGLAGLHRALGHLDELIGALSAYSRRLSASAENLPDGAEGVRLDQEDSSVTPEFVCTRVANHLQAAAAGMDQARRRADRAPAQRAAPSAQRLIRPPASWSMPTTPRSACWIPAAC